MEEEKELIARSIEGDKEAFASLVQAHQDRVYTLAYRLAGDREDAADLCQEAFIKAYRGLSRFRFQSSFGTWIYRITVNVCRDYLRSRARHPRVSLEVVRPEEGIRERQVADDRWDPEALYDRKEGETHMSQLLNRLSPDFRLVVVLRDVQDLSYEEIARITGVSLGTVKSRINRARRQLRDMLLAGGELEVAAQRPMGQRGEHS